MRGTDEHASLVDPHGVRHVDEAEELVGDVRLVDERGMGWRCGLDELPGRGCATDVERDGDDGQTLSPELCMQCLPPGQVISATSP